MLFRAAFSLALVCLVPFHEPDIGLPRPPVDSVNQVLAELRQNFARDMRRVALEIRSADFTDARMMRRHSPRSLDEEGVLDKLRRLEETERYSLGQ